MEDLKQAPLVIFVYKRLDTLKNLVNSLLENEEAPRTDLIVFSDGPKNFSELNLVDGVRKYIIDLQGFQTVTIHTNSSNIGLANSILNGVSKIFSQYDRAIFLEDDHLVSRKFLFFMNLALRKYEHTESVGCISGFSYPTPFLMRKPYFLRGAEAWSFATWRRVWNSFEMDSLELKLKIDQLNKKSILNMYGYNFYKMLDSQIAGNIDSWGIRWWANAVYQDLLCLYPAKPYCINMGWGQGSTHIEKKTPLHYDISELSVNEKIIWPKVTSASWIMLLYLKVFNYKERFKSVLYSIFVYLKKVKSI